MSIPCVKGGMKLSEALDSMQLAYNPITKQLHFVSPKVDKKSTDETGATAKVPDETDPGRMSKKGSFSDEGNFSLSTCEKSDTSDSPKSTLLWSGHRRGKDGGSFSSTVSSLSECSLSGGYVSRDDEEGAPAPAVTTAEEGETGSADDTAKYKKKGLSGFFSRGVFPWRSSGSGAQRSQEAAPAVGVAWRLFGGRSSDELAGGARALPPEPPPPAPAHRRQGSSASEKQFEDLVASSIALIQHDRPSGVPAKCSEEALRHRAEHARMVEAARRRGEREAAARRARHRDALRHEETLARHAREWTTTVLTNWEEMRNSKRTLELWWCGLPPCIRGKVWQLAIDNRLQVTLDTYHECVARAKQKLQEAQLRRKRLKVAGGGCKGCGTSDETVVGEKSSVGDRHSAGGNDDDGDDLKCFKEGDGTTVDRICDSSAIEKGRVKCQKNLDLIATSKTKSDGDDEVNRLSGVHSDTDKQSQGKREDSARHSANLNGMHRNFSEQNLKSHCEGSTGVGSSARKSSRSNPDLLDYGDECSMELIQLDIARTFPHLCIFQPGGPYFDVLHELLAAYVCYRPDIGYVQGMSFIGAMLILNMEAPQAFICFANLLDGPVLKAAFTRDGETMQRLWNAYSCLLSCNLPALAGRIAPELYLLEWLYTAFAKAMPLDAACRVWDVFLRDGDTFLFRSALGVLHLYQEQLKDMDFIAAAQFLTKLPEEMCADSLFRSIAAVSMSADGRTFEELAASDAGGGCGGCGLASPTEGS